MVNVMGRVVELIILGVGILVYFSGFQTAITTAITNASSGSALGTAMGTVLGIVPYLVFVLLGLEVAFPGALSSRLR
jgi:hypothetical protein